MAEKTMMEILRAECPGAADALQTFFAALVAEPALDEKTKQLVYVAAAAAGHVRGVPAHVARLRALGAIRREVLEALLMTGAPCSNSRAADRQRSGPWAVPKWSAIPAVAVDLREQVLEVPPSGHDHPSPTVRGLLPHFGLPVSPVGGIAARLAKSQGACEGRRALHPCRREVVVTPATRAFVVVSVLLWLIAALPPGQYRFLGR